MSDPVTAYARAVVEGNVPAGKLHRLACERHLRDLETQEAQGLKWRPELARKVIGFFSLFKHFKGEWGGKPIVLEPWQQFIVGSLFGWVRTSDGLRRFRNAFIELPRGNGKSTLAGGLGIYMTFFDNEPGADGYAFAPLALDTPVPTPSGWTTMGALKVGDEVYAEDGSACKVTALSPIYTDRECFAVTFEDGTEVVADGEHRWMTDAVKGVPRKRGVRTTAEIADTLHQGFRGHETRPNHSIPVAGPVEGRSVALPVPPYTLGVWLGDGRSNRGAICSSATDSEEARSHLEADGFQTRRHWGTETVHYFTVLGLRTQLRKMGLLDNKHVPPAYLRAPVADREALLQGLMDTDGTCTKTGECRFINERGPLADAVYELAASLGATPRRGLVTVDGKCYHRVSFNPPSSLQVFRLARKRARLTARTHRLRHAITAVRPTASVPVRCISVDSPSHLFLVSRAFIATHNTKKDQARVVFNYARQMVMRSSVLREWGVVPYRHNLHDAGSESKFDILGSDSDGQDGLRPHFAVADELHKHPNADMVDVVESGMGTRRQPLLVEITTRGEHDGPETVYGAHFNISSEVLNGVTDIPEWFAFIAAADPEDDWAMEATWRKANPNYGVSIKPDFLHKELKKALVNPHEQIKFKRLYVGQSVERAEGYFPLKITDPETGRVGGWDTCNGHVPDAELEGRPCWIGIDLSSRVDLTAVTAVWWLDDDVLVIRPKLWLPALNLDAKRRRDRVPYVEWQAQGLLETTPGNVVDQSIIREYIKAFAERWNLQEVAYDPWNAGELAQKLKDEDGLTVVEARQGYKTMSEPTKRLLELTLESRARHGGHPILRWMASNVKVREDANGNVMPDKQKSRRRIDGVVATIIALWRAMLSQPSSDSVYSTRGVISLRPSAEAR